MKKSYFYFLKLLILCFCSFNCLEIEAATFHAILVGDTDDDELNQVTRKDLRHMQDHIEEVFNALEMDTLNQAVYRGNQANVRILTDLKNLKVEADDIVFFYFSGHGFHTGKDQMNSWPYLYFNHGDIGIHQYDVLQLLVEHNPRLIICFADCCNNVIKKRDLPLLLAVQGKEEKRSLDVSKVRQLFLENQGMIIISSASPTYYAEGTDERGSCFTNSYLKFFQEAMTSTKPANWNDILFKTQKKLWKRQKPHYELNFY